MPHGNLKKMGLWTPSMHLQEISQLLEEERLRTVRLTRGDPEHGHPRSLSVSVAV